mmetsp:Transcript_134123/g.286805  ORF Transcript_134123/g.286805 Transcript_134123/m.286805 type:complete len:237 (-) Transcript_134123:1090-1800(-)
MRGGRAGSGAGGAGEQPACVHAPGEVRLCLLPGLRGPSHALLGDLAHATRRRHLPGGSERTQVGWGGGGRLRGLSAPRRAAAEPQPPRSSWQQPHRQPAWAAPPEQPSRPCFARPRGGAGPHTPGWQQSEHRHRLGGLLCGLRCRLGGFRGTGAALLALLGLARQRQLCSRAGEFRGAPLQLVDRGYPAHRSQFPELRAPEQQPPLAALPCCARSGPGEGRQWRGGRYRTPPCPWW